MINQSRSASEYVKDQSSLVDGILNGRLAIFDFNNTLSSARPEAADPRLMITNKVWHIREIPVEFDGILNGRGHLILITLSHQLVQK